MPEHPTLQGQPHYTLVAKSLGFFITIKSSCPQLPLSSLEDLTLHQSTIPLFQTSP